MFQKFLSHSIEIRAEIDKCEEIVSHQSQYSAMTPELAIALRTYKIKDGVGNGLIPVEKDGLYGYMNLKGENVIPCKYKYAARFREGLAKVSNKEGQIGFIDIEGNIVIPFSNQITGSCFYDGFVGIKTSEGMGFMDKKGKIKYSGKMHVYNYDCVFSEGVTAVMVDKNKYAYVNEFGDFRVEPFEAYGACPFYKNVAPVRINQNGKIRAALISEFGDVVKFFEDYFNINSTCFLKCKGADCDTDKINNTCKNPCIKCEKNSLIEKPNCKPADYCTVKNWQCVSKKKNV